MVQKTGRIFFALHRGLPGADNEDRHLGERHRQYLKKYRRIRYCNLLTSGQLNAYLADVNSQAEKLFFQLVNEFAQMVMNLIY